MIERSALAEIARLSQRLGAGLLHALDQATGQGHCFLAPEDLREAAGRLLGVDADALDTPLRHLHEAGHVVAEEGAVFPTPLHEAECRVVKRLKELLATRTDPVPVTNLENAFTWVERQHSIELAAQQRSAIERALAEKMLVITGGPGTGKTTVLNSLLAILARKSVGFLLAAPTGRAAKRMEAATGHEARTLHRLLAFSPQHGGFQRNASNPLHCDMLVVDEASMLDLALMDNVLQALTPWTRLLLVGDVDQLPSVGPGNVLLDIIASGRVPVVRLDEVFRQAAESGIVRNAHRINTGEMPAFNTTDFFLIERDDPARATQTIVEVVGERLPKTFQLDPRSDIQVLAPVHRGDAGVGRLNEALQAALNAGGEELGRKNLRMGDKVVQQRNNYDLDIFNGDVGFVRGLAEDGKGLQIDFEGRLVDYPLTSVDDLALAYATTVHKAQGSEYRAVVLSLMPQHYLMLQRNVLYTAVTRAKAIVVVVGTPAAVAQAARNSGITRRNTRLAERLRD